MVCQGYRHLNVHFLSTWYLFTFNVTKNSLMRSRQKCEFETYPIIIGEWARNKDVNKQSEDT
jgi:hypothetical protein